MTSDETQLHAVVQDLRIAVATLQVTVQSLAGLVELVQTTQVTREAHDGLKATVEGVAKTAEAGIKRNDDRWSKLAWFICLAVGAAVLALVVGPRLAT